MWQGFRWEWVTPDLSSPATQCKNSEGRQLRVLPANPSFPRHRHQQSSSVHLYRVFIPIFLDGPVKTLSPASALFSDKREQGRREAERTVLASGGFFGQEDPITVVSTCYLKVF